MKDYEKKNHELTQLIQAYKTDFYRLAYSYVDNENDAMDVVQEAIYKAFKAVHNLKHTDALKTWLFRIVINTALDVIRKRRHLAYIEPEYLEEQEEVQPPLDQKMDLKDALSRLPYKYRHIIILHYFEDLTIETVAAILDENLNTIKTRLYKALKMLRIDLKNEEHGG
ncbi:MAG: sigma-70 family RNA polymerase sigma factor [Sporolactobacillus sp.]